MDTLTLWTMWTDSLRDRVQVAGADLYSETEDPCSGMPLVEIVTGYGYGDGDGYGHGYGDGYGDGPNDVSDNRSSYYQSIYYHNKE